MHDVIPNLTVEDRERSLGWLALWWIETFCVVGSEPAFDKPVRESPSYDPREYPSPSYTSTPQWTPHPDDTSSSSQESTGQHQPYASTYYASTHDT